MAEFRIGIAVAIPAWSPVDQQSFPNLAYAVRRIGESVHARWVGYARGEPMPNGMSISNRTGQYARSIGIRDLGPLAVEVFSDLAYASAIENGAPTRDLKRMLHSSLRVRINHKGQRYLIIPFRWNHPGSVLGHSMPEQVWEWWQGKHERSAVTGLMRRFSGTGASDRRTKMPLTVPAWSYRWGARLTGQALASMGIEGEAARRFEGMVNFRKPKATGGGTHSKYITFRVMSESSRGWIAKATPGKHPAQQVADEFRPMAEDAFQEAAAADIQRLIGGT